MMTNKFINMCNIYKLFATGWECDFSYQAMVDMYNYETYGVGDISITGFNATGKLPNGYAVGKKWLNVTVSMWLDELYTSREGWCNTLSRIYNDGKYPKEWLDDIFEEFKKYKHS